MCEGVWRVYRQSIWRTLWPGSRYVSWPFEAREEKGYFTISPSQSPSSLTCNVSVPLLGRAPGPLPPETQALLCAVPNQQLHANLFPHYLLEVSMDKSTSLANSAFVHLNFRAFSSRWSLISGMANSSLAVPAVQLGWALPSNVSGVFLLHSPCQWFRALSPLSGVVR